MPVLHSMRCGALSRQVAKHAMPSILLTCPLYRATLCYIPGLAVVPLLHVMQKSGKKKSGKKGKKGKKSKKGT